MLSKTRDFIKRLITEEGGEQEGSVAITDPKVLDKYIGDPSFPFLVSFPRTGSHWLRMLMELYFDRPLLTRTFFHPEKTDYLLLHTHDLDLDVRRENVIYLYRDPVETIFSQIMYHKEGLDDEGRIRRWSDLYGRHLSKWLYEETFTKQKTVLRYERFRKDASAEFRKVAAHFNSPFDEEKLKKALAGSTKERLKEKTGHDQQVVNLKADYDLKRDTFHAAHSEFVWEVLLRGRPHLKEDFKP